MVNESYWRAGADFARKKEPLEKLISPSQIKRMESHRQITWQQVESYFNGYHFAMQQITKEQRNGERERTQQSNSV